MIRIAHLLADSMVIAKRNVIKIKRVPEVLVFVLVAPTMMTLMFSYVFGGSINVSDGSYREFLIAGIFAQSMLFGATSTSVAIAEDKEKGIIDRFRSLPMSQGAVLAGRTASDVIYNVLTLFIMSLTGLVVGWRINTSLWEGLAGFGLLLAFSYAFSWIMAFVGVLVPSVEVINNAGFMVVMPLTFIANTFVPIENLPTVLRVFAEWNPVSALTQGARELFGNIPFGAPEPTVWPLQNPVVYTLIWVLVIIAIFAPLANLGYRKAVKQG